MVEDVEALKLTLRGLTVRLGNPSLEYVLGGEGNTSVKLDYGKRMIIKAGGTTFLNPEFVTVDVDQAQQLAGGVYNPTEVRERMKRMVLDPSQPPRRPSKEVAFHSILSEHKWIVHTHEREIEGFVCSKSAGKPTQRTAYLKKLEDLTESGIVWIPCTGLGISLAKAIKRAFEEYKREKQHIPEALFLQNHGIIVGADDPRVVEGATGRYVSAVATLRTELAKKLPSGFPELMGRRSEGYVEAKDERTEEIMNRLKALGHVNLDFSSSKIVFDLVSSRKGREYLLRGNIAPEQIQYLGLRPIWVDYMEDISEQLRIMEQNLRAYKAKFGAEPRVVYFERLGVVAIGRSEMDARLVRSVAEKFVDVLNRTLAFDGPRYLTERQEKMILAE